jgi:peptidoglycan/LPS O-acetylase OafA/YrhL
VVTKSFFAKQLNLKLFYAKRFFRILPLIIFFLVLTTISNQFIMYFNGYFTVPWDSFFLETLAVLGSYYTNLERPFVYYNGAMWSLSIEMQFYLVFPLFLLILSRLKTLKPYFLINIFLSIYLLISVFIANSSLVRYTIDKRKRKFLR